MDPQAMLKRLQQLASIHLLSNQMALLSCTSGNHYLGVVLPIDSSRSWVFFGAQIPLQLMRVMLKENIPMYRFNMDLMHLASPCIAATSPRQLKKIGDGNPDLRCKLARDVFGFLAAANQAIEVATQHEAKKTA